MKCLISTTLLMVVLMPLSGCSIEPSQTDEPEIKIELGESNDPIATIDPYAPNGSTDGAETGDPDAAPEAALSYTDQYTYDATWDMLIDVCRSEGIDDDRCKCLMDLMVAGHGIDAAMYVAMEGHMHHEPAAALRAKIGDLRADRANEIYGYEQDLTCSNQPSFDDEEEDLFGEDAAMDAAADEAVGREGEGRGREAD